MGFTYVRSELQKFIPTWERTLLCSISNNNNNNVVLLPHSKGLPQRFFIGRFLSLVNLRTLLSFSTKTERVKSTNQNGFMKKTLAISRKFFQSKYSYSLGGFIALILSTYEKVPYSDRNHFVLSIGSEESKLLNNVLWKLIKRDYKGSILPSNSKEGIRVKTVMVKILGGLNDGLRLENASTLKYSGDGENNVIKIDKKVRTNKPVKRWYGIKHLEKMKWEVLVVDSDELRAFCLPSGKVVVSSGLLEKFKDEAELAIILGHEVAHVVAQHTKELSFIMRFIIGLFTLLILLLLSEDATHVRKVDILKPEESHRREFEADYIGLMLMASAGYDPQLAPELFTKLDKSRYDFLSTHPTGTRRRNMLEDPQVMAKAVAVYTEVQEGLGLRSFI